MLVSSFITWLVVLMSSWTLKPSQYETHQDRFTAIARDALEVSFDPTEEPLFKGEQGRQKTALLLLSIASLESGYRTRVEDGKERGDHGGSVCYMQLNIGDRQLVMTERGARYSYDRSEGWNAKDILADRKKCFKAGLHMARMSFDTCGNLSVYTTGRCFQNEKTANERLIRAQQAWKTAPFLTRDVDLDPSYLAFLTRN